MADVWEPKEELSDAEEKLLKLCKKQKLWSFLRRYRHVILDEEVSLWLKEMYAEKSRGTPRIAPQRLLLAMLLQVGFGVADHEVPTLTAVDRRWQMVLDLKPSDSPAFSQGTVFHFRERLREHGVMTKFLEKTVRIARETGGFNDRRLRALIDSSPLLGAGRVEDTFNLLGRAIVELLQCTAELSDKTPEEVIEAADLLPLTSASIKAVLDVDWTEPDARTEALNALIEQFYRLENWLRKTRDDDELRTPPLSEKIETITTLIDQDTEPEPDPPQGSEEPAKRQIKKGGSDRLISLSDRDMRHGRKSKTKVFSGYKRHVAVDADITGLIVAVHIETANRPEYEAADPLLNALNESGFEVVEVHIDRGYLPADSIHQRRLEGTTVISKPHQRSGATKYFPKKDFIIDFERGIVECPNGEEAQLRTKKNGELACSYPIDSCRRCPFSKHCTPPNRGRQVQFHRDEQFHREMSAELKTPEGRADRRRRIPVEHALSRVGAIQGRRARFRGLEKNQFDLERTAVVANLFAINRLAA